MINSILKKARLTLIIPIIVMLFNVFIILRPGEILAASQAGLSLWFNNVFPALLPFVIGVNILSGLGIVNFLGVMLSPLMTAVFGVPGCGGFALITGFMSGYPMGAKITADLRLSEQLTKDEANRLICFTNNSGPLFILGAVGAGLLGNVRIGYFIMGVHYISAIVTGIVFRNLTRAAKRPIHGGRLFGKACQSMNQYRKKDGRRIGQILSDSVKNAMEAILMAGGFIILFCVLVKIMELTNLTVLLRLAVSPAMAFFGINPQICEGVFTGLLEMTNGVRLLSALPVNRQTVTAVAGLISFGGLSIHAQAVNFLSKTDISSKKYILSKLVHGMIAAVLSAFLFPFFDFSQEQSSPVFIYQESVVSKLADSVGLMFAALGVILLAIIASLLYSRLRRKLLA